MALKPVEAVLDTLPPLDPRLLELTRWAAEYYAASWGDVIRTALWEKFLFIDPRGCVGAVSRAPVGEMLAVPETRALLLAAMREVEALGRRSGARLPGDAVERTLKRVEGLPADATASMQRDVLAGRPSELHEQTGAVVRLGRAAGVPVPVHEALLGALLPQERKARAAR